MSPLKEKRDALKVYVEIREGIMKVLENMPK